ncbi:MAG: helix-turn-helix domain-containing protein [Oligoflexus sp.]
MPDASWYLYEELKLKGMPLLNQWVRDGLREDLHLDFKRKSRPREIKLNDDDRKNYSKALSGFANSDSGLIIWGIGASSSGNSLRTKHPIRQVRAFAEMLDSSISRLVNPAVSGAENFVIFEDQDRDLGYVVSYIPKSASAPHRAEAEGLKQYYMRYGESFKIAEHFELEFMFGKRQIPDLRVFWGIEVDQCEWLDTQENRYDCRLKVGVTNQGKAIAKYTCLRLRYNSQSDYELDTSVMGDLIHYSHPERASKENFYSVTARALLGLVVYPDDYTHFFTFKFQAKTTDIQHNRLPAFEVYYDIFAENLMGKIREELVLPGKKIAEKIRKRIEQINDS